MSDTLTLTFKNEASRLELRFAAGEGRTFNAVLRIRQGTLDFTFSFYCFGYDLAEFAREFETFHARYEGVARFINQTGDVELEFSLVHPGRGIITIVATWSIGLHGLPTARQCHSKQSDARWFFRA